jgi:hypothetical protein
VAPLNGGDPAGGVNPPYLNLYTHTGLVFNFQTLDTNNVIKQSSTQACASGCLVYVGNYSATLSYTTMMKPTDKLAMKFYSNSAFNQNWVGGPNANQYTITANAGNVIMFVNECPNP